MDAPQTSGSAVNNQSLLTECCCRPARALVGAAPIEPSCHGIACQSCLMEMLHLPIALRMVNHGPALLDIKGRAQLFDQGGHEVHPSVTQQLSGHSEDCYKALIEHLHDCLGCLVFCHHSKGIPHEMVGHHKDIFHHGGLVQLHHGLDAGVVEMHKLQQSIHLNWTEGSPWHFSLKCLAAWASPHYSSAILSHHGPPQSLLSEGQGPLLALVAGVPMYPVKHHTVLSCGDDEG